MRRTVAPELMDDPAVPRDDLERSFRFIRFVNRRLGGTRGLLRHLRDWSVSWPRDRPVTLLDVATGSADIPIATRAWARSAGFDLRITAVDLHPTTLDIAGARLAASGEEEGIALEQCDALQLMDRYTPWSFDYVHAGMFLHHLGQVELLTMLRIMDRLARRGIVWNDLLRSRVSLASSRVLSIGQPLIVKHDSAASIRAGFTKDDVLEAGRRVGIDYARFRSCPIERFTFAGERPRAWE